MTIPCLRSSATTKSLTRATSSALTIPFGDPGLMRHDEEPEMLLQSCQGRHGIGKEHDLGRRPQMAAVLDDRAVSVQEYRWCQFRSHGVRVISPRACSG